MPVKALFAAPARLWEVYASALPQAFAEAGLDVDLSRDHAPDEVDYIIFAPRGPLSDFTPYRRARAVLGLWAGVEGIVGNPTLHLPLARMVDEGLTQGMVEYVTGHTLRHHLGMDAHIAGPRGIWQPVVPPLARDRPVTVLGLGALGGACARALAGLGFAVTGWSMTAKDIPGVTCLAGMEALAAALAGAQIVVLLVPLTAQTENLMDATRLALPARGAALINPGRGALIEDAALLAALDSGQIGHATLDVFRTEPLPPDHPFWAHPRITVTPHIAAETRPLSSARVIAANIARGEAGLPLLHHVDRTKGY